MILLKNLAILVGSVSLVGVTYIIYLKRCYKYLKSLGYDHPKPKFFIGNLLEFASEKNSVSNDPFNKPVISHYSKTLKRFTSLYGKIYGYYEGHSPVLVLADPDLVTEFFVNQNKLSSYRRTFPMSKSSDDPTADVFVSNGIRWLRVRYGLEKVMLNLKNIARCLEYTDESFLAAFIKQPDLNKTQKDFSIHYRAKLFIIFSMFNVIFGTDLETFIAEKPFLNTEQASKLLGINNDIPNLKHAQMIANKFSDAFEEYESFSLLKFFAMTMPELKFIWRKIEKFKKFFNRQIFVLNYFADPMDWFQTKFVNKHLALYASKSIENCNNLDNNNQSIFSTSSNNQMNQDSEKSTNSGVSNRKFGYLNSFLSLSKNPIFKYPKNNLNTRIKINPMRDTFLRNREFTASTDRYSIQNPKIRSLSERYSETNTNRYRTFSNDFKNLDINNKKHRMSYISTNILTKETESNEFENWKLTVDEALSNSLLMLFAGYETTSSAIGFCCHVLANIPEEKEKLLEEIKENWKDLSYNLDKYNVYSSKNQQFNLNDNFIASDTESSINDDVFEEEIDYGKKTKSPLDEYSDLYDSIDKLKYLDMFVKEVLRMFPIANSMVSRKCVLEDFYLDGGKYYIPKDMNVVVDVLSIHYDKTLWGNLNEILIIINQIKIHDKLGPVDPDIFYPERFLTERNPAAWLAFGIGARKCLGMKLAISQIKLFLVRFLQNYELTYDSMKKSFDQDNKFADSIETKDVLFNGPIQNIQVSISRKQI